MKKEINIYPLTGGKYMYIKENEGSYPERYPLVLYHETALIDLTIYSIPILGNISAIIQLICACFHRKVISIDQNNKPKELCKDCGKVKLK